MRELPAARQGLALIETAVTAPFLILLILGIVDMALYGTTLLKAQQAVNRGLEMSLMAGPSLAKTEIQDQAAAQAEVAAGNVVVTQTLECAGVATDWALDCSAGQETERYTQIDLSTTYTPTFALSPSTWMETDDNGSVPISVTGVIRVQ